MGASTSSIGDTILFPAPEPSYDESLPGLLWIEDDFPSRPPIASVASRAIELQLRKDSHSRGRCFPAFFVAPPNGAGKYVLLYWHGNSCDLGHIKEELEVLSGYLNCHCLAIEFPGYGLAAPATPPTASAAAAARANRKSRVSISETINKWSRAAFNFLVWMGAPPTNIICFGRSIGTGPAAHLAATLLAEGIKVGGVVLHAPYISVHKIVAEYTALGTWLIDDHWDNAGSLQQMAPDTPLLIIHGEDDEIIPTAHGRCLLDGYEGHHVKHGFFPSDSSHNAYYVIDDLGKPIQTFLAEAARGRSTSVFEISIPPFMTERPSLDARPAVTTAARGAAEAAAAAAAAGVMTVSVTTHKTGAATTATSEAAGPLAVSSPEPSGPVTFNRLLECGLLSGSTLDEIVGGAIREAQALEGSKGSGAAANKK
ncbi:alpha/beta hydrolase domain-containing protein 17B-like [Cyclospora cayetanensis]|uniref:Alpha/beta hydrolase domain-containing protein 17B-like n=1 Tax=Cyclospora cayetanensis TaxID=88456 RepID=A0A6P6S1A5_9EIME|nr:alpha/beta hydrolase domain-containing protein 17B-like [Cyclospora cayetanensis]